MAVLADSSLVASYILHLLITTSTYAPDNPSTSFPENSTSIPEFLISLQRSHKNISCLLCYAKIYLKPMTNIKFFSGLPEQRLKIEKLPGAKSVSYFIESKVPWILRPITDLHTTNQERVSRL
jgi:hypothetical protein